MPDHKGGLKGIEEQLEALLDEIKALRLDRDHAKLMDLVEGLGLLQGLKTSQAGSRFLERLEIEQDQKKKLARYAYDFAFEGVLPEPGTRLFFESGTTIAHLVGRLAHEIEDCTAPDDALDIEVLTNNLFALTALATLVGSVAPTAGHFDNVYYGFFPFSNESPPNTSQKASEVEAYHIMQQYIERCGIVFATCSNFSLLFGPRVGGRANALVKHAIHTKTGNDNRLLELFHFEKLIPLDQPAAEVRLGGTAHRMAPPKEYCQWVFPPPELPSSALPEIRGHDNPHAACLNGEDAGKIPILDLADIPAARTRRLVPCPNDRWYVHALGSDILIGLPSGREREAVEFLKNECAIAGELLTQCKAPWAYGLRNADSAAGDGVLHLQCEERL